MWTSSFLELFFSSSKLVLSQLSPVKHSLVAFVKISFWGPYLFISVQCICTFICTLLRA